jgi:hypothetical protein
MLNECVISFKFEFFRIHDRYMSVVVGDDIIVPDENNHASYSIATILPSEIKLQFLGKNQNTDTIVDQQGNILQDLYVKIVSINLDQILLPDWIMQKNLYYLTEANQLVNSSYIGFNSSMTINLTEENVFYQYQKFKKIAENK